MPRENQEAHEIDILVASRIEAMRKSRGLSRTQLASKIGVTHQQLAKIEHGVNRISAGKLVLICRALNVRVDQLFDNLDEIKVISQGGRMAIDVSRNFMRISDSNTQYGINQLVRILADKKEVKDE